MKWFSRVNEPDLVQADLLLHSLDRNEVDLWVPDLFFHEVANTLALKTHLSDVTVERAIRSLFNLALHVAPVTEDLILQASALARLVKITVYDSCYCVVSKNTGSPLVTANPRHQAKALGCQVIPLAEWKG